MTLRERLSIYIKHWPWLYQVIRSIRACTIHPVWDTLLRRNASRWHEALRATQTGPHVLLATSMGGFQQGALLESTLAVALTLRGAQVDVLLCDSFLPACQLTEIGNVSPERLIEERPQPRCASCHSSGREIFNPFKLSIFWYGKLITRTQKTEARHLAITIPFDQIPGYHLNGIAIGEHALAGTLRYFASGTLVHEPASESVLRAYLESAILTVNAIENLLDQNAYNAVCFNHGIYVPQGLIGEVCRRRSIRVVNWNPAYRKHCFIFSHGDSYHHTMISEPIDNWENLNWTAELEKKTLDYLKSRWHGTQDWIWFHEHPQEDIDRIAQETGIDFSRPCIGLLTNVMWDAQLHFQANAFPNMLEWVLQTIQYFVGRPELQLVIRVHPAEIRGSIPSRQPIIAEIERAFPQLPHNVFVITPESQVSTYALLEKCNVALIYGTKTGIEVSSMGIPVIVAGEAWIRNKGFSLDASTPNEYFRLLDRLPLKEGLNTKQLERARKYAFHFFFRRMIPLPFIQPANGSRSAFTLGNIQLDDLAPGRFPGLDVICNGIIEETPFIYCAEQLDQS